MRSRTQENRDIIAAVQGGDRAAVENFVRANPANLNAKINDEGHTLLDIAINSGQLQLAKVIHTFPNNKAGDQTIALGRAKMAEYDEKIQDANSPEEVSKLKKEKNELRTLLGDIAEKKDNKFVDSHADAQKALRGAVNLKELDKALAQAAAEAPEKLANMQAYGTVKSVIENARAEANGDIQKERDLINQYRIKHQEELAQDPKARAALTGYLQGLGLRAGTTKVSRSDSDVDTRARVSGADRRDTASDPTPTGNKEAENAYFKQLKDILANKKTPAEQRSEIAALKEQNKALMSSPVIAETTKNALSQLEKQQEASGLQRANRSSSILKAPAVASTTDMHRLMGSKPASPAASPAIRRKERADSSPPSNITTQPAPESPAPARSSGDNKKDSVANDSAETPRMGRRR